MASSTTFDKILCLADPGPVTWWQVNKGSLTVGDDGVTFQGRKPLRIAEPVSVSRVHSGAWANDLLRVGFAQGNNVGFIFFGVAKRGKPAAR